MTMPRTLDAAPPERGADPLYRLVAVRRTYQSGRVVTALDDVDLEIAAGEFVTIQGPTGGGKSTLLQLLGALDRPTSGSIALDGADIATASDAELGRVRARDVGFVFQGFNLIDPHRPRERRHGPGAPPPREGRARRSRRRRARWGSPTAPTTVRGSSPAGSSSASRSRARSRSARACCSPTSPPATSTRACATRSSARCRRSTPTGSRSSS